MGERCFAIEMIITEIIGAKEVKKLTAQLIPIFQLAINLFRELFVINRGRILFFNNYLLITMREGQLLMFQIGNIFEFD